MCDLKYNECSKFMKYEWKPRKPVSNEDKLKLYGLYKQINEGNCTCERPWGWEIEKMAKYDAWKSNFNLTKDAAQMKYIEISNILINKYGNK